MTTSAEVRSHLDDYEYAVGHNVSAIAVANPNGGCQEVRTAWIPTADVEKVIATQVKNVEVGMEALAAAPTAETLRNLLSPMVSAYSQWIDEQRVKCPTGQKRLGVAKDLLDRAGIAKDRIAAGLKVLDDPQVPTSIRCVSHCQSSDRLSNSSACDL